jgi:hypothetical protein
MAQKLESEGLMRCLAKNTRVAISLIAKNVVEGYATLVVYEQLTSLIYCLLEKKRWHILQVYILEESSSEAEAMGRNEHNLAFLATLLEILVPKIA